MYEDIPKRENFNLISDGGSDGDTVNNNAGICYVYVNYIDNYRMPNLYKYDRNMKLYLNILSF